MGVLVVVTGTARADFSGTVVGVIDGDTVDVLVDRKPVRVRLAEIDAPESRQPFGARSKQVLSDMVYGQQVTVREGEPDRRWDRVVGTLSVNEQDVNRAMVAAGMAWAYRQYLLQPALLDIEAEARASRRGLWADPEPVPPWQWRRTKQRLPSAAR